MKDLVVVLVALVLWSMLPSCNSSKKLIVKEWKVTDMEMESDFSSSPKHMEIFKNFKEKAQFVFNKDGTYFFDLVTDKQNGNWTIKKKGKLLVTVSDKGLQTNNTIIQLTDSRLVIKEETNESPMKLILAPKK
jgi:hypothetical protein